MVATPIGNLADISLRALYVLSLTDAIACEDTRHTQTLLRAYGIERMTSQLIALHQHNEEQAATMVIQRLGQGQRIAYASDAGTPAVSDPGARLVAAVRAQGLQVIPVPGASSVTAALSVAGVAAPGADGASHGNFVFAGFMPAKAGERAAAVTALALEARCVILLEAPHRIATLAAALAVLGARNITVGRELTKQFEEIATMACSEFSAWLRMQANRLRGEFVLVLHPVTLSSAPGPEHRVLRLLLAELPLTSAVKLAAEICGESRNVLYEAALAIKKGEP